MGGSAVFDASVVVKLVADEPGSEAARRVFAEVDEPIITDWTALEVSHALWKRSQRGQASFDATISAFQTLGALSFAIEPATDLLEGAFVLAMRHAHPVYDCLYVALARDLPAPLVTADKEQRAVAEGTGVEVVWIDSST